MITIAYMTNRRNPRFEWFADGLKRQGADASIELLVVDFYAGERDLGQIGRDRGLNCRSITPKPTVWQGEFRLTKQNYFAAANARNTAICAAKGSYIVFADDLSVPGSKWLERVQWHAQVGDAVAGSYQKLTKMVVVEGELKSFEEFTEGKDHRRAHQVYSMAPCFGSWFFGCSCGGPIEAFLETNGFPEIADGMGYEDSVTGDAIRNNGRALFFDKEMLTFESEEAHHEDASFLRPDPGVSPNDKSHALLNICRGVKRFDNYFGPSGIRGLRQRIQNGEQFPVVGIPEHEWFTGTPLRDL